MDHHWLTSHARIVGGDSVARRGCFGQSRGCENEKGLGWYCWWKKFAKPPGIYKKNSVFRNSGMSYLIIGDIPSTVSQRWLCVTCFKIFFDSWAAKIFQPDGYDFGGKETVLGFFPFAFETHPDQDTVSHILHVRIKSIKTKQRSCISSWVGVILTWPMANLLNFWGLHI